MLPARVLFPGIASLRKGTKQVVEIDKLIGDDMDHVSLALHPAEAGRDDEGLPQGVRMPRRARAALERDLAAGDARGLFRLEQGIDPDRAGEPVGRAFA